MKKTISTLCALFFAIMAMAQVPELINYQAVARNNSGQALANQAIKVRLTINKNAVAQYSETRQAVTNALGLFNVQIGSPGANSTTGTIGNIDWQNNAAPGYVLKVELDVTNSGVFTDMGSQALVSVPYAFASKKADEATETVNIAGRPIDQSATPSVGARLSWDGTNWTPVKKDMVIPFLYNGITSPIFDGPDWKFINVIGPSQAVSITGNETIIMDITGGIVNIGLTSYTAEFALCYQLANQSGPVTPINSVNNFLVSAVPSPNSSSSTSTQVHTSAAFNLSPGTYYIGLAVRDINNPSIPQTVKATGTIEIKY